MNPDPYDSTRRRDPAPPNFYLVQASIARKDGPWIHTYQVPTFYLNTRVLGIKSWAHAREIAQEMMQIIAGGDATVSLEVWSAHF